MSSKRIIMHVDVNSAYLAWEAVFRLQTGESIDLREIPSAVGGSQESRHGIILAKSTPAKKFGVETGEVIWQAKQKCPNLILVKPNYELYMKCSNALVDILKQSFPVVQRFSIDECFADYTGMDKSFGDPVAYAHQLKERIKNGLGFTVNVGIGTNKLLAKVAGDLKKPDMVHTLLSQEEIENKMWPLPVRDLFMVGAATEKKLKDLAIFTIRDLAKSDPNILKYKLKSHGTLVWQYANAIDQSPVRQGYNLIMKGVGNGTTVSFDVTDHKTAYKVLLSLTESVAFRLRAAGACCGVISVEIKDSDLRMYSHQRKLFNRTNLTNEIFKYVVEIFNEMWKGERIRHLGVRLTDFASDEFIQASFFDTKDIYKKQALDEAIDSIRQKYGNKAIMRAIFADYQFSPMTGGAGAEDYPVMSSIL